MTRDSEGRITLRATRVVEPIVLDGKLDDLAYARVKSVTGFIQQEPDEGEPASEETEAWIFFDDRNFYVSVRCWDSHPERMIANEMRRDHNNIRLNENMVLVIDRITIAATASTSGSRPCRPSGHVDRRRGPTGIPRPVPKLGPFEIDRCFRHLSVGEMTLRLYGALKLPPK